MKLKKYLQCGGSDLQLTTNYVHRKTGAVSDISTVLMPFQNKELQAQLSEGLIQN